MLASTMQISNNKQQPHPDPAKQPGRSMALHEAEQKGSGHHAKPAAGGPFDPVRFLRTQQCVSDPVQAPETSVPTPSEEGGTSGPATRSS